MKAHLVTFLVIDHDDLSREGVVSAIEHASFPNDCVNPIAAGAVTYEVGDWSDDHPLNQRCTDPALWLRIHAERVS